MLMLWHKQMSKYSSLYCEEHTFKWLYKLFSATDTNECKLSYDTQSCIGKPCILWYPVIILKQYFVPKACSTPVDLGILSLMSMTCQKINWTPLINVTFTPAIL
jgi:hypothetical protein